MSDKWPYPGARWWKFDFHAHTPASTDTLAWQKAKGTSNEITPESWLLRYMAAGVDCIAVTDHNTGAWVDALKTAYKSMEANPPDAFREIHLFPGVELSVNGGFHLLALFDRNATTSDIDTLLGKVDYAGTKGLSDGVTRKSPVEVFEAIAAAGGLAIPAHADQAKGLLKLDESGGGVAILDANTLRQVFERGRVLAMEVVTHNYTKPQIYVDAHCGWCEVLGSDCHNFQEGPQPGERSTWIKMAVPTIGGLRLALIDGVQFSIHRSDEPQSFDPFHLPEHFIESVTISNARFMGHGRPKELRLSPWFNALVGGRGTGKSTVVHGLRLAFQRQGEIIALPESNDARRTFEHFIQEPQSRNDEYGALDYRTSRKTEIVVTLIRNDVRYRLRWQQDSKGSLVEEQAGKHWQPSSSQSVTSERFPVRIFSQGQIAALAGESQHALLAVIDEAAKAEAAKSSLDDQAKRFLVLSAQLRELTGKLKVRDDVQVKLSDVQRKLASFEGKQHAEVLKAFDLRSEQEHEIERQIGDIGEMVDQLRSLSKQLVPRHVPTELFNTSEDADQKALIIIDRLHSSVVELAGLVEESSRKLEGVVREVRSAVAGSAWQTKLVQAKNSYTELVNELATIGVSDTREYGSLVEERRRIVEEVARLDLLEKEHARLIGELKQQRIKVRESRQLLSKIRSDFLNSAVAQNPYVKIELIPYGRNPRGTERAIREAFGVQDDRFEEDILIVENDELKKGVVAEILRDLPDNRTSAATMIEERLDSLCERLLDAAVGHGDFGGHLNNYLVREFAKRPEFLDRFPVWYPEDGLKVEYSPNGDGMDFRSIGQASAGQRAAAMLAFLLAEGDEPLVLDQPEDDLDNHLIYDLVVRQIRANKLRRQITVVTHNPNIVVNGDAEMLHALDFKTGQCRIVEKGSFQDPVMREEICRVMEGGREAFERRYKRLGRET